MSDEFYDEDGFRLEFEDDTADQEKQFFMRAFPNVNKISERKVHCTSCYMHIGTAPITEAVIRMHPILRVTHCRNCHTFYNSGEFDKGEDGSELYCRWCGQGGEVYCCSKCPYVFCKKCIVQNLSRACVQDISRNDNWQCFSCAPKIMWHLRAQHWALVNYIEKQKKDMKDKNLSVQTINNLMKQDNTTCCSNKGLNKKSGTPVSAKKGTKRPSDANEITSPGAAKIPDNKRILPRPIMPVQQTGSTPPASKKVKTDNNEVVCTPDIMSMFMNPEEPPPLVSTRSPPVAKPPAPKPSPAPPILPSTVPGRQVVVRPAIPANASPVTMRMPVSNQANAIPPPVYHTINGYRIDLHTAAQQGTYRLPNGKLIQVRKQAPAAAPTPAHPPNVTISRNIAPKPPNTYFNPISQNSPARMTNGGSNMHINIALQQQQQLQEQRLQQQRQQQQQQQMLQQRQQQMMLQAQAQAQAQAQVGQPQPTIVAGQPNPALQLPTLAMLQNLVNGPHEDSPLGKSRKNFEGKLLSGVEICQHIVNKINTLTNSNSFKNIRNVRDLKELYIHVSYLLTYAIGRFKTLQEKCVDDVKKMGFTKESDFVMMGDQISNRNPDEDKSDDEDDCEIIEQNTTLIELDSEDEDDGSNKKKKDDGASKSAPCSIETEAAVATILQEKDNASSSCEVISVDSVPQISAVEGNVSLDKDDTVDKSTENASAEEGTTETAVDGEASTEATEAEKSKKDDDLVEIIETDENEAVQDDADKAEESEAASKDGDGQDDVVEIIEADEDEEQQEKEADKAECEEKKDSADEENAGQVAEEKQQEAVEVEAEQKKDSVEGEKVEQVAEDKQESVVTVPVEAEETSKEVQDVEMETSEVEKPAESVESVDVSKADESENKENELPEVNSEQPENASTAETEADKEVVESEKLAESEKMEVDAQKEDEEESSSAAELTQKDEKCDESEDAPVSAEPVTVSDAEPEPTQTEDEAPVAEAEESKRSDNVDESADDSQTTKPIEQTTDASVESVVDDNAELSADAPEEPAAQENAELSGDASEAPVAENTAESSEETPEAVAVEDTAELSEDVPEVPAAEETPSDESPAAGETSASIEGVTETPSFEKILAVDTTIDEDASEAVDPIGEHASGAEDPFGEEAPAVDTSMDESFVGEHASEAEDPIGEEPPAVEIPDVPTGNELLAQIEDSFQKLQEMIDSTEDVTEETNDQQLTEAGKPVADDEQMEVDDDVSAAAPSEDQQEVFAQSADETESSDVPMVDDERSVECNGLLEENGTTSSDESQDASEELVTGDTEPTEVGKTVAADDDSVNSPETINGDC